MVLPHCNVQSHARTEINGVKLSNVERKSVKSEGKQQLSNAGHKALPHQPLPPPFLVLTVQDSSTHKLASLAICVLKDTVLNHRLMKWYSLTIMDKEEREQLMYFTVLSLVLRLNILINILEKKGKIFLSK